jgi:hypothetical protein
MVGGQARGVCVQEPDVGEVSQAFRPVFRRCFRREIALGRRRLQALLGDEGECGGVVGGADDRRAEVDRQHHECRLQLRHRRDLRVLREMLVERSAARGRQ